MIDRQRLERQIKLVEVGESGQSRLSASSVRIASDGGVVAAEYLHRAGVRAVEISSLAPPRPCPHASAFRFAATRRVAAGAWTALLEIRQILEMVA